MGNNNNNHVLTPRLSCRSLATFGDSDYCQPFRGIKEMTAAPSRGVVYCAVRSPLYLEAALISALALRQLEPDLPIVLLSDFERLESLGLERFHLTCQRVVLPTVGLRPQSMASRWVKTHLPEWSPFAETLYLDADVLPIQPIEPIWECLQAGSLALAVDVNGTLAQCDHVAAVEKAYTLQQCAADSLQWNGGVMLWQRCPAVLTLFETWQVEWQRWQQHDQLALLRSLQTTALPVVELPNVYNFPASHITPVIVQQNQVRLLHCWGGFVKTGRFRAIAQRLMPHSTAQALQVWQQFTSALTEGEGTG
ncbi:hypothetical protein H6F86_25895 [Phormidium sp. FACHB-592]|uniref:Glycosyl transferase n=1 Tax=Stenomitos frigidus AS-A4 TaxID=2933935 RepID=A0ABV0KSK9_9CYAN|nr:hypothetical protein [Phormidium sp. FACHB-592]MBD2077248.1 hypothetical protein [Phormidium sp. FACHB-592]